MQEKAKTQDSLRLKPEDVVSEVNTIGGFSLSPDGTAIAFSWKTTGGKQIYVSPLDKFKPAQLTDDSESKTSPCWSPDGGKIAYLQDKDGNECFDVYTINPTGGSGKRVTELAQSTFRGLDWSPDGCHLAFSSNRKDSFDIYTVRADGHNLLRLTFGAEQDVTPQWSPDGSHLLFVTFHSGTETHSELRIINRDATGLRSLGPVGAISTCACWSPDGTRIAFASNAPGVFNIGTVEVKTGEISWQTREGDSTYLPVWSPDGKLLACLVDRDGSHRIAVTEIETGRFRIVGPLDGLSSGPEFTPDGKALVFTHEGPKNPSDLWYLCLSTGELRQMTNGCPDTINRQRLVTPEIIHYPSFDELEIPAFLYKPLDLEQNELPPAIVWVHGGPNYQFMNRWNPTVQLLVSHGYVVLAPNFRGSTGYGEEYRNLSISDWGGGDLKDIIAAADYIESTRLADSTRIALWGGSYGGYLMLLALAEVPDRWAAGVNFYGFVDLESFYRSTQGWIRQYVETQIGTPEENPEFYRERSPITSCENISAPLLFFQGANDPRVSPGQSKKLMSLMESHNKVCMLKVYEDEGHGFQKKGNKIDAMRMGLDFLNMHLGQKSV